MKKMFTSASLAIALVFTASASFATKYVKIGTFHSMYGCEFVEYRVYTDTGGVVEQNYYTGKKDPHPPKSNGGKPCPKGWGDPGSA